MSLQVCLLHLPGTRAMSSQGHDNHHANEPDVQYFAVRGLFRAGGREEETADKPKGTNSLTGAWVYYIAAYIVTHVCLRSV